MHKGKLNEKDNSKTNCDFFCIDFEYLLSRHKYLQKQRN